MLQNNFTKRSSIKGEVRRKEACLYSIFNLNSWISRFKTLLYEKDYNKSDALTLSVNLEHIIMAYRKPSNKFVSIML